MAAMDDSPSPVPPRLVPPSSPPPTFPNAVAADAEVSPVIDALFPAGGEEEASTPTAGDGAPSYNPSSVIGPSPSYRRQPRPSERMLAHGTIRHRPAARYEKSAKRLSISLGGQEPDCTMPSYGRAGLIDGVVTLAPEALENALKLEVKVLITFLALLKFQRLRSLASPRLLDPRRDEVGHCRGRRHNPSSALPYYPAILLRHAKPLFRSVYFCLSASPPL